MKPRRHDARTASARARTRPRAGLWKIMLANLLPAGVGLVVLFLWIEGRISFREPPESTFLWLAVLGLLLVALVFLCWICLPVFAAMHRRVRESIRASRRGISRSGPVGILLLLPGYLLGLCLYVPVLLNVVALFFLVVFDVVAIVAVLAALLFDAWRAGG